jgi:FHS family Na+ dependent glucose MFS transporter 1
MMKVFDQIKWHKVRFLKTVVLLSWYMAFGTLGGIIGPTLLDLRQQVQTSLTMVSYCLTARAAGNAIGAVISKSQALLSSVFCFIVVFFYSTVGLIYPKVNFQVALVLCLLYSTGFVCYIPYIKSAPILLAVFAVNQIGMGALESGTNMFMLHLWGKEVTPFLQALHFMYGVGAMISPVIAVPFLVEKEEEIDLHTENMNQTAVEEVFHPEDINLVPPYCIVAAVLALNAVFALIVWRMSPETPAHPSRDTQSMPETFKEKESSDTRSITTVWKIIVIILTLFFLHIYLGLEISFGSFMTAFAVKSGLGLSKADGAHLTTLFWSTFTLFRIITLMYLEKVGSEINIFMSLFAVLVANVILVPFGTTSVPMLWTGTAIIGIGLSSVYACTYGFLEEYFPLSPLVSALMTVSGILGEFVFPVVISSFIDDDPMIVMWVTLFCSIGCSIIFMMMSLICRFKLGKTNIT